MYEDILDEPIGVSAAEEENPYADILDAPEPTTEQEEERFSVPELGLGEIEEPEIVSGKAERRRLVRPASLEDRMAQAEQFQIEEQRKQRERDYINFLQSKIDKGGSLAPLELAYYRGKLNIPEERMVLTAKGLQPASKVGQLPAEPQEEPLPEEAKIVKSETKPQWESPELAAIKEAEIVAPLVGQSAATSITGAVSRMMRGIAELPGEITQAAKSNTFGTLYRLFPESMEKWRQKISKGVPTEIRAVDNDVWRATENAVQELHDEAMTELRKEGGLPTTVTQAISEGLLNTAITLTLAGAAGGGKTPIKNLTEVPNKLKATIDPAITFGNMMAITTPGGLDERAMAAVSAAAFVMAPITVAGINNAWLRGVILTGENMGISATGGAFTSAVDEAKRLAEEDGRPEDWKIYLAQTVTEPVVMDLMFGILGASKRGNRQAQKAVKTAPQEMIKKLPPEIRTEWEQFVTKEARDAIEKRKVQEGDLGEYRGVSEVRPPTEAGGGDRIQRGGAEPERAKPTERVEEAKQAEKPSVMPLSRMFLEEEQRITNKPEQNRTNQEREYLLSISNIKSGLVTKEDLRKVKDHLNVAYEEASTLGVPTVEHYLRSDTVSFGGKDAVKFIMKTDDPVSVADDFYREVVKGEDTGNTEAKEAARLLRARRHDVVDQRNDAVEATSVITGRDYRKKTEGYKRNLPPPAPTAQKAAIAAEAPASVKAEAPGIPAKPRDAAGARISRRGRGKVSFEEDPIRAFVEERGGIAPDRDPTTGKTIGWEEYKAIPLRYRGKTKLDVMADDLKREGLVSDDFYGEALRQHLASPKRKAGITEEQYAIEQVEARKDFLKTHEEVDVTRFEKGDKFKDAGDEYKVKEVNDQSITVVNGESKVIPIEKGGDINTVTIDRGSLIKAKPEVSGQLIPEKDMPFNLERVPEKSPEMIAKEQAREAKRVEEAKKAELKRRAQELPITKIAEEFIGFTDAKGRKFIGLSKEVGEGITKAIWRYKYIGTDGKIHSGGETSQAKALVEIEKQFINPPTKAEPAKFPTLLEFAKSKLPKSVADKITSESQVESYRAQWNKERMAIEPAKPAKEIPILSDKDLIVKPLKDLQESAKKRGIDIVDKGRKEIVDEIKTSQNVAKKEKLIDEMPVSEELKRKRGLRNTAGAIGFEKDVRPKVPALETDVAKVERMFAQQRKDASEKGRITLGKIRDEVSAAVFGADIPLTRRLLENGGKDVVIKKVLGRGWGAKADEYFNDAITYIKETVPHRLDKLFDDMVQANRTIEVSNLMREKRGVQSELFAEGELPEVIKSPGGLGAKANRAWLDEVKRQHPKEYEALEVARKRWNETMRKQIDKLLEAELIDKETHDYLVKNHQNFSPRRFIQHVDPEIESTVGGRKVTVRDSGLEALDKGSEKSLLNDTSYLLGETIASVESRIAKNKTNKALYDWAKEHPDNALGLKMESPQEMEQKLPPNMTRIGVMIKGKPQTMVGPTDMMKYWVESDPQLKNKTAIALKHLSGTTMVKALATGYNPAFSIFNIPRDLFHYFFVVGPKEGYSQHLPIAWAQQAADMKATFHDAIHRTGRARDYIDEGGGMAFLSTQGQLGRRMGKEYASVRNEAIRQTGKIGSWLGETSELWLRLALRERGLKKGLSREEATYTARTALDFAQGGYLVKTLDNFFPYLNAGTQATRNVIDSFRYRPAEAIYKTAQLVTMGAIVELINHYRNREANDSISDAEKMSKWIITLPFYKTDKDGNKRYFYIPIAKEQAQQPFAAIGQELMRKYLTGKASPHRITMAIENALPADIQTSLPPVISALLGYVSNKNFWSNEDIWKGRKVDPKLEYYASTPEGWKKLGKLTGLSPERLRKSVSKVLPGGNPFLEIASGLQSPLEVEADDSFNQKMFTMLSKLPMTKRIIRVSAPVEITEQESKEIERRDISLKNPDGTTKTRVRLKEELHDAVQDENNMRHLNDVHLNLLINQAKRKEIEPKEIGEWLRTVDPKEGKRLIQSLKHKYYDTLKKLNLLDIFP
jgi:hypothetical protein